MYPQRWVFTESELKNPDGLTAHHEFITTPLEGYESGVIIYRNGRVSNRWEDGTAGVPTDAVFLAADEETLYDPDKREYADTWRDVWVDENGVFIRFR